MNRIEALNRAAKAGAIVRPVKGTGEVDVIAPDGTRLRLNNRRKDAVRSLTQLVARLEARRPR